MIGADQSGLNPSMACHHPKREIASAEIFPRQTDCIDKMGVGKVSSFC